MAVSLLMQGVEVAAESSGLDCKMNSLLGKVAEVQVRRVELQVSIFFEINPKDDL